MRGGATFEGYAWQCEHGCERREASLAVVGKSMAAWGRSEGFISSLNWVSQVMGFLS